MVTRYGTNVERLGFLQQTLQVVAVQNRAPTVHVLPSLAGLSLAVWDFERQMCGVCLSKETIV